MRILQLMNRVPWPAKDGGSLGYLTYTMGYAEAGCEVTVCALNTRKHYFDILQLPPKIREAADWRSVDINTDVTPVKALANLLFTKESYHISRFISHDFELCIKKVLQEKEFDVIIFESLFMAPYLPAVRKFTRTPCVLRQHNVEYRIWETLAGNTANPLKRYYLRILASRLRTFEQHVLNHFDALTTVTDEDAAVFKEMGCVKPVKTSPFGIHFSSLPVEQTEPEQATVFHLGSMEWQPNQQAMIWFINQVWPKVLKDFPGAKFFLAGRGMPEYFSSMQVPNMVVPGEVEDAYAFMKSKEIMIVPLFSGSGIRVKILEGMALAKTIVSTRLGAAGIHYKNGEHLVIAETSNEFADAIVSLLRDTERCRRIGRQAQLLVKEEYDNTKLIRQLLLFYKEIKKNI